MLRRLLIAFGALAAFAVVAAALTVTVAWRSLNSPLTTPEQSVLFEIRPGMALGRVSRELADAGLIEHPGLLSWYGRLRGVAAHLHAGEYRIEAGTTPIELLDKFVAGNVFLHQITIIEGWRYTDLLDSLSAHPAVVDARIDPDSVMTRLGKPGLHPEGQFLPDTYRFPKGTGALELLRLSHRALETRLNDAWARRAHEIAIDNPYEALILASIIEKETALAAERPRIAGVFHRRLQRGMRLQTDPTVIYGLGDGFDGNLRRRDLTTDTPYNTYTRHGLPPTPIALPSAAAIEAAVLPEPGTALYFVASGEPDGSHRFSDTLDEHNAAVRAYVERLRGNGD